MFSVSEVFLLIPVLKYLALLFQGLLWWFFTLSLPIPPLQFHSRL